MTIPDDIMKTAGLVAAQICNQRADGKTIHPAQVIASAILAERERCAKVASPNHGRGIFDQYENGRRDAAAAIRKGDTA